jgi:tetratricopeptide (TPR) repeat protein
MSAYTWQHGLELIKQGNLPDAERVLREVIRGDPLSFEGHLYLGAAVAQQGRYDEAVGLLRTATEILPDHPAAHYNLGFALEQTKDLEAAVAEYQTTLRLKPDHAKAGQRLHGIEAQRAAQRRQAVAAATPGSWASQTQEEPVYSEEELEAADRAAAMEHAIARTAVMVSWGIGLAALFCAFSQAMGVFYGAIIVLPVLGPMVYLVALDGLDWFSVNPKLAIPVSVVGLLLSAVAVIWAIKVGAFSG